jgi:hypothetical protein
MQIAPMNAHIIWSNLGESHINNINRNIDNIPISKRVLLIVLRYCDPITLEEFNNPKLGHWISGLDNYYLNIDNDNIVEYAIWNDNTDMTTVYRLGGRYKESQRTDVNIDTLPKHRILIGKLVPDKRWDRVIKRSREL